MQNATTDVEVCSFDKRKLTYAYQEDFRRMFALAGFETMVFYPIPNEYYGDDQLFGTSKWFMVDTDYGKIKIGPRKNVINVDWSATGRDLEVFFYKHESTVSAHYAHAWNNYECLGILTLLYKLLSKDEESLARQREFTIKAKAEYLERKKNGK